MKMKAFDLTTILHALIVIFSSIELQSQAPRQFYYQIGLRDNNSNLISNQVLPLKVSIKEGGTNGAVFYTEEHNAFANTNGLVTLSIGSGNNIVGSILNINWSTPKIIVTMIDLGGGNYVPYNEEPILSVPFALYAENSGQGPPGIQGPTGTEGLQGATGEIGPSGIQGIVGLGGLSGSQGLPGPIGQTGPPGIVGVIGQSGPSGIQGPSGLPGAIGQGGPQGSQGTIGNGFESGSAQGQMRYWNGNDWVELGTGNPRQILTFCDGKPTWTNNGQCPGLISSLNCQSTIISGVLIQGIAASNVSISVPYSGGNGGIYSAQSVGSTGVAGLTASLGTGTLVSGQGNIIYTISGTPTVEGMANFVITIGGVDCELSLPVISSIGISVQASCGANNVHNPFKTYGTITDQEGNQYKTITIGTQEWMAENLKTSIYRNGDAISYVTENVQWGGLTTGAWSYYNNDSQYECPYGKLYNWYAVADPRNICPTGWHVPSDTEWNVLIGFFDPTYNANISGDQSTTAGNTMKSSGLQYWLGPNQGATNQSGFSALPGGCRVIFFDNLNFPVGEFSALGGIAIWHSSTEVDSGFSWFRDLNSSNGSAFRAFSYKQNGLSVRCLRD